MAERSFPTITFEKVDKNDYRVIETLNTMLVEVGDSLDQEAITDIQDKAEYDVVIVEPEREEL